MPLGHVIDRFCSRACKDPRDKVCGLQGTVLQHERVVVDYRKPVHAVFVNTVQVLHTAYVNREWHFGSPLSVCNGEN